MGRVFGIVHWVDKELGFIYMVNMLIKANVMGGEDNSLMPRREVARSIRRQRR